MGLRDDILGLKPDTRLVKTKGGEVLVRGFTLALKDRIQMAAMKGEPWRGLALMHCCLDPETEEPLFGLEDVGALNDLPNDMEQIIDVATELSALPDEEIAELEGN